MKVLTKRELEILNLVKVGTTNKEIAFRPSMCEQTVKNHLIVIYKKLAASDRAHAVYIAMKRGIIV